LSFICIAMSESVERIKSSALGALDALRNVRKIEPCVIRDKQL
jgi:hypothetical protein